MFTPLELHHDLEGKEFPYMINIDEMSANLMLDKCKIIY